jgi:CHAT domain-containing protein
MYHSEKMESVSDYVISSYTPTIGTLLRNGPLSPNPFKMIVIVQPQTPGQKPLPCTLDELQKIEARVTNKGLVVRLMPGYTQEVISHLPSTSIAHFACHAQQNAQNPLDSALILQDGELRLSRIMHQPMPGAALAFLSADAVA